MLHRCASSELLGMPRVNHGLLVFCNENVQSLIQRLRVENRGGTRGARAYICGWVPIMRSLAGCRMRGAELYPGVHKHYHVVHARVSMRRVEERLRNGVGAFPDYDDLNCRGE